MSANRINGVRLKITRAKKHIADLESVIVPFFDPDPYTYVANLHPQIPWYVIQLKSIKALPDDIAILAGDAVHNLRSSLDHLMWQLVEAGGGTPDKSTYFPIVEAGPQETQRYLSAVGQGEIPKIRTGAHKILEEIQPYRTGDKTLARIHHLDIWDKHRLVVTTYACLSSWGLKNPKIWLGELGFGSPVVVGDEICRIPKATWDKSHDNIQFGFFVAFGEPEIIKGESVLETLQHMADFVDAVVTRFEPYLS